MFIICLFHVFLLKTLAQPSLQPHEENEATIGLSIIVKNEAHVIVRMLQSISFFIDYYIVVDTGSTDSTISVISDFFRENNIPGRILQHAFVNFEDARNVALDALRNDSRTTFGFWIDADEEVVLEKGFALDFVKFKQNLENFDHATMGVQVDNGPHFFRKHFFRLSRPYRWVGPVHELLVCEGCDRLRSIHYSHLKILSHTDGGDIQKQSKSEKYLKRARLLEGYLDESDRLYPRWVFYTAELYRSADNFQKSIHYYRIRVSLDDPSGNDEERYFSQLMIAKQLFFSGSSPEKVIEELLICHSLDTERGEHLYVLSQLYQQIKNYEKSYFYSKLAFEKFHGNNPFPIKRGLNVRGEFYDWNFAFLHAKMCQTMGKDEEMQKTLAALVEALKKVELIRNNEVKRKVDEFIEKYYDPNYCFDVLDDL